MALATVIRGAIFKFVLEGLQEDTLVSVNQVILGTLALFQQLPNAHIALCNGILHQQAHWLVAAPPTLKPQQPT